MVLMGEGPVLPPDVSAAAFRNRSRPSAGLTVDIPLRSRVDSLSTISSPGSVASALPSPAPSVFNQTRHEDDVTVLERYVSHKIQERIEFAEDELDRVDTWLDIVRMVLNGVESRAEVEA